MGPGCSSWQFGYFLRTARGAHFLGSTQKIWVCGAMVVVLWVSGRHPHSLRLWAYEDVQVLLRCFFYLPSKCDRSYWLYLWHTTSSMKLHFAHFFPMLTFPWRNSRALIVTDANTRSFFHGGSGEHAHRLHVVHKNKSLSTNLNRKLPRLLDLCFYKLHYTDSKFFTKTNFVLDVLSSSSTWLLFSLHACPLQRVLLAFFY